MKKSKVFYDKESDSLYFLLRKGKESYFDEIEPNVIIEFNNKKEPIGIEILKVSSSIGKLIPSRNLPQFVNEKASVYKASPK